MSLRQKQKQLSLLDLEPPSGEPTQREMLYWETWNKQRYQRLLQEFEQQYQESPILRRRLPERKLDLYMTHPTNSYLVDQITGELIQESTLLHRVWGMDIRKFSAERRRHLSAQIAALLDGKISAEDWNPEIAQPIGFHKERQGQLQQLLQSFELGYSLERDGFRKKVWVFGPPDKVNKFFKQGQEAGILS
jgi:hypothetical protein